jgi:hypothetical protein
MKKFECNVCIHNCKIELKNVKDHKPYWCVYNGEANWQEVEEQENTKGVAITEKDKDVREKLITSLLIDFYFNRCEGIKTETLIKIKDLVNWDLEEYYGE